MHMFDFFVPKLLLRSNAPYAEAEKLRYRFVGATLLIIGVVVTTLFVLRSMIQDHFDWSLIPAFFVGGLCISVVFWLKFVPKIIYVYYILMPLSMIVLPLRLLSTGGFNSPILIWVMLFCVFSVVVANGRMALLAGFGVLALTLIGAFVNQEFPFINKIASNEIFGVLTTTAGVTIIVVVSSLYAYLSLLSEDLMRKRSQEISDLQKKLVLDKRFEVKRALAVTYNHELNNPLMIAKGALRRYRKTGDESQLKKALQMIERMNHVINQIEHGHSDDVELEDYTDTTQMVKIG